MTLGRTSDNKIKASIGGFPHAMSCACCRPCRRNGEPLRGENVFEISKQEYYNYYNGGTWTLNSSFILSETTANTVSSGSGSVSGSVYTYGCYGEAEVRGSFVASLSDGTATYFSNELIVGSITYRLGFDNGLFLVKFMATATNVISDGLGDVCGPYPPLRSITVAGRNIPSYSTWCPGWMNTLNYANHSSVEFTATYNQGPSPCVYDEAGWGPSLEGVCGLVDQTNYGPHWSCPPITRSVPGTCTNCVSYYDEYSGGEVFYCAD
jgi:hypothetical protein